MMTDSKFKIIKIQAGFDLLNHWFAQMKDDVWQKFEERGFVNMTLAINGIRKNIQTRVNIIKLKFQSRITSQDKNFI